MGKLYKNGIQYGGSNPSNGHVIYDTDDNALPVEPGLQFKGLKVTDDSSSSETDIEAFGLNSDSLDDVTSGTIPQFSDYSNQAVQRGNTYYVDGDNGSDGNDGLSPSRAFKSIQKAVNTCGSFQFIEEGQRLVYDQVCINLHATNPYTKFYVNGKVIRLVGYDFTNNVIDNNTGTLTVSDTSGSYNTVEIMQSIVYFSMKNISIACSTTALNALMVRDHSSVYHNHTSGMFSATGYIGIQVIRNSFVELQGTVGNGSKVTLNNNSQSIIITRNSGVYIAGSLNATSGGASTINLAIMSYLQMGGNGSTTSNLGEFYVTNNNGAGGCIQCNQMAGVNVGNYYKVDLYVNSSISATSVVHCAQGSNAVISGYTFLRGRHTGNASVLRAYNSSSICWACSGTINTNMISVPTSGTTNYAIASYTGSHIYFHNGTVTGYGGLLATQMGRIGYSSITNNATNKTSATNGGRIYSGNQSSIPNY